MYSRMMLTKHVYISIQLPIASSMETFCYRFSIYSRRQYKVNVPCLFNDCGTVYSVQLKLKLSMQHLCATILWEQNYRVLTKMKTGNFRIMV